MLLAANIGNSRISMGFFSEKSSFPLVKFQMATDLQKTSDEYFSLIRTMIRDRNIDPESITEAIVSSVVPQITMTFTEALASMIGKTPLIVGPGVKTGFPIKIDYPSELGGDIVADTAATLRTLKDEGKNRFAAIIVHMGTVTTVSAINRNREYVGCSIFPGIRLSLETLHGKTAQLPNVSFSDPEKAIGRNSQDAVRSGVVLGHAMMIDGLVGRFARELKCDLADVELFLTGEEARSVLDTCKKDYLYDEDLTLKGLYYLFRNTVINE